MAKAQKKTDDPLSVGRHAENHVVWGYEVFADGSIRLSPSYSDRICELLDREAGLRNMQQGIAEFVAQEMKVIHGEKRKWWNTLETELTINPKERWSFDPYSRTISKQPPEETETPK